ncbi:YsnF/AvaK domain-containing protein [Microvirga roseola]|uniref:YsnF/AvaK domain-containing protein n=1 Tax=Microvirga roseola TaxID=2883126 RepID=UPI001E5F7D1C|nr:YsnF/AvaK domain-containing protein [Microvirga roseola]
MAKTVTCLYGSEAEAASIVRRLEDAGVSQGKISLFTNAESHRLWEGTSDMYDGSSAMHEGVANYLRANGVPDSDARAYAEGVRRGNALVAVRCEDAEVDQVVRILDSEGVLDIDEQQEAWRSDGWMGYGAGMAGVADSATTTSGVPQMRTETGDTDRDEVIPVAEEELHVGKREMGHGRVRITSHVVERPVEEQVTLRQEHVDIERRPVEGSARTGAMGSNDDLFRERSIEMEEHSEEPVISKDARVTEEVVARKDVDRRTETVSDTVRKTEVEVEDERGNRISRTGTRDDNR